jgi:hypothetical protein
MDNGASPGNAFTALCELASREHWCWHVGCTTCGHGPFRWALRALARGKHPNDMDWSVHCGAGWTSTTLAERNGPLPPVPPWPLRVQRALQTIVACSDLQYVATTTTFPAWLGYLGLALWYTEDAERVDGVITLGLVPQLLGFVSPDSAGDARLREVARSSSQGHRLLWRDLESIERSYCGPRPSEGTTDRGQDTGDLR